MAKAARRDGCRAGCAATLRSVKILIGSVVALILAGVGIGVAYVSFLDGKELRYPTQTALRAAVPGNAAAELQARGHTLRSPLTCVDMPEWTKQSMRVQCTGSTSASKRVQVIGAGEDKVQEQYFTILVDGRPVVQNAGCLGADCRKKD